MRHLLKRYFIRLRSIATLYHLAERSATGSIRKMRHIRSGYFIYNDYCTISCLGQRLKEVAGTCSYYRELRILRPSWERENFYSYCCHETTPVVANDRLRTQNVHSNVRERSIRRTARLVLTIRHGN